MLAYTRSAAEAAVCAEPRCEAVRPRLAALLSMMQLALSRWRVVRSERMPRSHVRLCLQLLGVLLAGLWLSGVLAAVFSGVSQLSLDELRAATLTDDGLDAARASIPVWLSSEVSGSAAWSPERLALSQPLFFDRNKTDFAYLPFSAGRPVFRYELQGRDAAPVLSVITPVYNSPALSIADSVLRGSFQQLEWIIVNDGSTDAGTLAMLAAFSNSSDPRIRYYELPANAGLPAARNAGARLSTAPFLLFADADDVFEPTYLEKCVMFLQFHPRHAVCGCWSLGFGAQQYVWDVPGFGMNGRNLDTNFLMSMSVMRSSAFRAVGGYDESIRHGMEDWDLWLHLLSVGEWGRTLPEYLLWYRTSARDRWPSISDPARFAHFKAALRSKYAALYDKYDRKEEVVPVKLALDFTDLAAIAAQPPAFNQLSRPAGRLRLLLLTHHSVLGGAELFNVRVVKELSLRGWEVSLVLFVQESGQANVLPLFRQWTNDVFVLPVFLQPAHYAPFLAYLIQSRHPHVVLLTNSEEAYLLLEYVRRHTDAFDPSIAFIDYSHMVEEDWKSGGYARYSVQNRLLLDRSLFAAEAVRRWAIDRGHSEQRTGVVYVGTDIAECRQRFLVPPEQLSLADDSLRQSVRRQYQLQPSTVVILYIARITPVKLPFVLAAVLAELADRLDALHNTSSSSPLYHCFVLGDGESREALETAVHRSSARSRVNFLGMVRDEAARHALMSAADIVFLPSSSEGLSMALMEGMSYGLVPVSVELGGQAEVIEDGSSGFLIPLSSQQELTGRFSSLLWQLMQQPDTRQRMADAALRRIQQFSTEAMVRSLLLAFDAGYRQRTAALRQRPASDPTSRQERSDELLVESVRVKSDYIRMQSALSSLWHEYVELSRRQEQAVAELQSEPLYLSCRVQFEAGLQLVGLSAPVMARSQPAGPKAVSVGFVFISAEGPLPMNYGVFMHFQVSRTQPNTSSSSGNSSVVRSSSQPPFDFYGDHPFLTSPMNWSVAQVVVDRRLIPVPQRSGPGLYDVYVGLSDRDNRQRRRLPIKGSDAACDPIRVEYENQHVFIGHLLVS